MVSSNFSSGVRQSRVFRDIASFLIVISFLNSPIYISQNFMFVNSCVRIVALPASVSFLVKSRNCNLDVNVLAISCDSVFQMGFWFSSVNFTESKKDLFYFLTSLTLFANHEVRADLKDP